MIRLPNLQKIGDGKIALALGLVNVLIHFRWFFNLHIFTSGDWQFISDARYADFLHFSPIWIAEGMGTTSAVPAFYFVRFLEGLLSAFGSSFALNEKLLFFAPIVLCSSIGAYYFLRQYLRPSGAVLGTLIFCFNTATLFNYAGVMTIATAYALSPVALYLFQRALEHPGQKRRFIVAALVFALLMAYEQRIFLIIGGLCAGIFVYFMIIQRHHIKSFMRTQVPGLALFGGLIVLLHAFWLVPYVLNAGSGVSFSNLLERELFESFSTVQNGLTLQHPFWTGARPATFIVQEIPWYVWLLPVVACAAAVLPKSARNKRFGIYIFWLVVAAVGIFLVKQANGPLPGVYPWLYENLPGAAAFREASKFYILIILAYAVLVPYSLAALLRWVRTLNDHYKRPALYAWRTAVVAVVTLFVLNALPVINGRFRTLLTPRTMPADYAVFNKFINEQPEYFRTLWAPAVPRWASVSNNHPALAAGTFASGEWLSQLGRDTDDGFPTQRDKAVGLFAENSAQEALQSAAVKYVAIPLRDFANEDDIYRTYGDDHAYFVEKLDRIPYLKKLSLPFRDLVVYENTSFKPYAASTAHLQTLPSESTLPVSFYYDFVRGVLRQPFNPVFDQKQSQAIRQASTVVSAPFDRLETASVTNNQLNQQLRDTTNTVLYVNNTARHVTYRQQGQTLSFYAASQQNLQVNGAPIPGSTNVSIGAVQVRPGMAYYVAKDNSEPSILPPDTPEGYLGTIDQTFIVYEAPLTPTYQHSFENGSWEQTATDCNPYDNKPDIDLFVSDWSANHGKNSLGLGATSHTACTTSEALPTNGAPHLLTAFDYRALGGQTVEVQVLFNDPANTVVKQRFDTRRSGWRHNQFFAAIPKDATTYRIRLLGHPDYLRRGRAVTLYDNIRTTLTANPVVQFSPGQPVYNQVALGAATATLSYPLTGEQGKERLTNGGFQEGAWAKRAWDCNEYDDHAAIASALRKDKGNAYLELRAQRHAACMSHEKITVQPFATYLLNFSHRTPNGSTASYQVSFNDPNRTVIEERLQSKKDWSVHSKPIIVPAQATEARITLVTYESSLKTMWMTTQYDNVSLKEMPAISDAYLLVRQPAQRLVTTGNISFQNVNPTTKTAIIRNAKAPFLLTQSELYNPLWKVRPLPPKESLGDYLDYFPWTAKTYLPATNHTAFGGYTNGWLIDPDSLCRNTPQACKRHHDGSYDLQLAVEYRPQRWFNIGLGVSAATLAGSLLYLILHWHHKARKKRLGHYMPVQD